MKDKQYFKDLFKKVWVEQNCLTDQDYKELNNFNEGTSLIEKCLILSEYINTDSQDAITQKIINLAREKVKQLNKQSHQNVSISELYCSRHIIQQNIIDKQKAFEKYLKS